MSVKEVASAEFYQLSRRTEGKLLVVQFTATWCGPCRRIAPQFDALARRTPDVEFVKVYEHTSRDAIIASGVRSFPTFHLYCGGNKVDECRGASIQAVEQKVLLHKASASAPTGPVIVKLRFEREKPRESGVGFVLVSEEEEVEVHAGEGLEIFKFQVLSITDIDTKDQALATGDSNTPIDSDASLIAALRRTGGGVYGNYPVIRAQRVRAAQGSRQERSLAGDAAQGMSAKTSEWNQCCSRTYFGKRPVIQPAYVIREESLLPQADLTKLQKRKAGPEAILVVCGQCAENCFIPGRAEHCPAISESAAFVCQSKDACAKGYGSDLFSGRADAGTEVYEPGSPAAISAETAAAAAADRMYYSARGLSAASGVNGDMEAMQRRIAKGMAGVLAYEDPSLQALALAALPREEGYGGSISQRAAEMAAAGGFSNEEGLARALLSWFKKDFFKWVNKPPCASCGARGASMEAKGGTNANPEEAAGKASRVELYQCKDCKAYTRFPRYNSPAKLLQTRSGRCGEWANCFALLCRAIGLETRHVVDWTDHVWTEIWIPARNKWVHADPCENKLDKPLMYEQGWSKRLSYAIAFDRDGAVDVTRRYTRRWLQTLSRRNLVPEKWLAGALAKAGSSRLEARAALVSTRLADEQTELKGYESDGCDGEGLDSEEKEGRQSGDAEWVASRGEGGVSCASAGPDREHSKPETKSPLIGAPLGVLHSSGGLALCVAAVVESTGDAAIIVGGATVCRLSGRGRATICAAAVSASAGLLLDARSFFLRRENNSSSAFMPDVPEWLATLPDGVVVALAVGGGAATDGGLDVRLSEELDKLVHSNQPDADMSATLQVGTTKAGVLVGWKGNGEKPWARRENKGVASNKRCAVNVELLLAPAPLSGDQNSGTGSIPVRVELKDKLCICPLQSIQAQTEAAAGVAPSLRESVPSVPGRVQFPVRGTCFREGEPAVLVGPTVDLVDCVGWTTVLHTTGNPGDADAIGMDSGEELPSAPVAWRVATVSPAVGGWHDDTEAFDDLTVGCPALVMGGSPVTLPRGVPFLPVGRVREIIAWSGDCVNGVQVVYDVQGDLVRGPKHMGEHGLYRQSSIVLDLDGGEVITEVSVKVGSLVDSLHVRTNKGREKKWGGAGGELLQRWQVPPGCSFLGFHGGLGGHIHSLGVTLAEEGGRKQQATTSIDSFSSAIMKNSLYSSDAMTRSCAQLLAFNAAQESSGEEGTSTGGDPATSALPEPKTATLPSKEVIVALETALKYADNLLASPLDPKFSRIRLANGFFDRKIGKLPGGGGVIRAMGFEIADDEGRMHYVFRRSGAGAGLEGLRRARRALADFVTVVKTSSA